MSDAAYFTEMEAKIPTGKVRTRFAPSPTGYMHIGNLRTALYTWLIARSHGGTFILRIEDTDQGRLVEGATDVIYRTMAECHLNHDEGPDIGGPVAPYIQSQRRDTYGKYARLLAEKGGAYYCFCEKCASEEDTGDFDRADDPCRDLLLEDALRRAEAGEPYVIRQRIPKEGTTTFHDAVFGDITVENSTLDDQVLLKRDGLPTYNFANVIDDHLMGITHVVRGSEYLSSAPKYDLLYHAFGWEVPTYVHCSPVMRDAQNKMSKRHGDPSYEDLKAEGYLTDAILNYVALLGWSPKGELAEQEIFSLDALVKAFDLTGISKSPAIFDKAKLDHFNACVPCPRMTSPRQPSPTSARASRATLTWRPSPRCCRRAASVLQISRRRWTSSMRARSTTWNSSPTRNPRRTRRSARPCWRRLFPCWRRCPSGRTRPSTMA